MFKRLLGAFSKDIGIDLGTANTLVYVKGRGIVINEPSVVALSQKTGQVFAVGKEAKETVGRTPMHIKAVRPLREGVISDFEVTQQMLDLFIEKVHEETFSFLPRPRIVISVPSKLTEVEKKAAYDAAIGAGAREVYLINEPMAAALGAKLPIQKATANMVVDIGGGTTEIAVISLGGIVVSQTLKIGGDKLNQDIIQFVRDETSLLLGEATAEKAKIKLGSAVKLKKDKTMMASGRDLVFGLPKQIKLNDRQIRRALSPSLRTLGETVQGILEKTPPELSSDIMDRGIMLVGGGSLLRGMEALVEHYTKTKTFLEEDPLTTVARGTGLVLENLDDLKELLCEELE